MILAGDEIANRLAFSIPDERRGWESSEDRGSDSVGTAGGVTSSPFNCVTCDVVVLSTRSAGAEEERGAADLRRECGNATSIGDRQIAQMRTSYTSLFRSLILGGPAPWANRPCDVLYEVEIEVEVEVEIEIEVEIEVKG